MTKSVKFLENETAIPFNEINIRKMIEMGFRPKISDNPPKKDEKNSPSTKTMCEHPEYKAFSQTRSHCETIRVVVISKI